MVDGERPGERDRPRRAARGDRDPEGRQAALGEEQEPAHCVLVQEQAARDVDVPADCRARRLLSGAAGDGFGHRQHVAQAVQLVRHDDQRLRRPGQHRDGLVAVRHPPIHVGGQEDRHREGYVRQGIGQGDAGPQVLERCQAALARSPVHDVRAVGARPEPGGLAAPRDRRPARSVVQGERLRRHGKRLRHERRRDADAVGLVHVCAGGRQQAPRYRMVHPHARDGAVLQSDARTVRVM